MNVLVYSGPGISQNSLSYTITTLRQLLQPNYVVQSVNPKVLATEPWGPSCALLVFPGGRDLPYLSSLEGPAMSTIAKYVRSGGSYLGFCAGAYFASGRVEWEMGTPLEVQGDRPLKFFPGPSHGCVYSGFQYESEKGARSVSIALPGGTHQHGLYYNGGGHFVMPESIPGIRPLAYYDDTDTPGLVAGVACEVEKGKAALWHVHLEFPANCGIALEAAARSSKVLSSEALLKSESDRLRLLRDTLKFLGLNVGGRGDPDVPQPPSKPLPQLLCGTQAQVDAVARALHQLRDEKSNLIEDANDTFQLHEATTNNVLPQINQDETVSIRHIAVFKDILPSSLLTPHFSVEAYFGSLLAAQRKYPTSPSPPLQSPIGSVLLYGEAVTSTQTLLQR
jgi:biotin---protein ligase